MDWLSLAGAVVTGASAVIVVWWQEKSKAAKLEQTLKGYAEKVQSADSIRQMVMQPAEGRWTYTAEFSTFFGVKSEEAESEVRSRGIAAFQWYRGVYNILLGYSNRDKKGNKISVSVNTGVLKPNQPGQIQSGDLIHMRYVHRVGLAYETDSEVIDTSDPKEDSYVFEVQSVSYNETGDLRSFQCVLRDHSTSNGMMKFVREF